MMKKALSLILSLLLCVSLFPAFAETTPDLAGIEAELKLPEITLPEVSLLDEARSLGKADDVVNANNIYTITTAENTILLDASVIPTFEVLTQSFFASFDVYSRFQDEAVLTEYINNLIDDEVHVVIWDTYNMFNAIILFSAGSDMLSGYVKDLSSLSEADQKLVASKLAGSSDCSLVPSNGNVWVQLKPDVLVTIVNSQYLAINFMPNGDAMTEDDAADLQLFVSALTLS